MGTAPNLWVYLEVFGNLQWTMLFLMWFIISLGWILIDKVWKGRSHDIKTSALEGFVMITTFSIQQGSHPDRLQIKAKRILALTTSMLTILIFTYYANDITSKMTAGPPPISEPSFGDVLNGTYKVITIDISHDSIFISSLTSYIKAKYPEVTRSNRTEQKRTEPMKLELEKKSQGLVRYGSWYEKLGKEKIGELAIEKIIRDPTFLLYCPDNSCDEKGDIRKGRVVAFEMKEAKHVWNTFLLMPDSEYLSLFNHYLLKAFETGILKRLDKIWNAHLKPPIKIGIAEPQPLEMYNVMLPFSLLAAAIVVSMVLAIAEKVAYKIKLLISKSTGGERGEGR